MARIEPARSRLRVGLFVSSQRQPRALVKAFAEISRSTFAEVVLVALSSREEPALPWLWRLYRWLDHRVFSATTESSDEVDLLPFMTLPRVLTVCEPAAGLSRSADSLAEIRSLRLDVAFVLGKFDCAAIDGVAKYGVWRLAFGLQPERLPGLEGFREVAEGKAMTCAGLSVRRAGRREQMIYESHSRTAPFSLTRNREKLMRRVARFPGRMLRELHRSGDAVLKPAPRQTLPARRPTVGASLKIVPSVARIARRIVRRGLQKLIFVDQWFMAFRFGDADEQMGAGRFRCLMPPKDRFWADPFPLERDGRHFLFFEELVFAKGKAHIAVIEVNREGLCSVPIRVLERPYHMSYPFLIETDGQLFMVPETGQNGTVELYRCLHFPDHWAFEKVLLRAPCCVDASLHQAGGKWWMFVNIGTDDTDVHDELHIYFSDSLCGEWHSHACNPIKSDVRSARSAGRLYQSGGSLFRPAQIGVPLYGSGISINQVLALTPEIYREREVERIVSPNADRILGVHTLNRHGNLNVVDGFVRRKRWGQDRLSFFEPMRLGPDSSDGLFGDPT